MFSTKMASKVMANICKKAWAVIIKGYNIQKEFGKSMRKNQIKDYHSVTLKVKVVKLNT